MTTWLVAAYLGMIGVVAGPVPGGLAQCQEMADHLAARMWEERPQGWEHVELSCLLGPRPQLGSRVPST